MGFLVVKKWFCVIEMTSLYDTKDSYGQMRVFLVFELPTQNELSQIGQNYFFSVTDELFLIIFSGAGMLPNCSL